MKTDKVKATVESELNIGDIDRSNPEHVAFLNQQSQTLYNASNYFTGEANATERALCAQLMLVNTVLFTGALLAIANRDLLNIFSTHDKLFMLIALLSSIISIFGGIKYYFKIVNYHRSWAQAKHQAGQACLDSKIKTWANLRKATNEQQQNTPEKLNKFYLQLQVSFIIIAALAYISIVYSLLQ